jgi:hypothetical protein
MGRTLIQACTLSTLPLDMDGQVHNHVILSWGSSGASIEVPPIDQRWSVRHVYVQGMQHSDPRDPALERIGKAWTYIQCMWCRLRLVNEWIVTLIYYNAT